MGILALELFPERDCSKCTDSLKRERGCNGDAKLPVQYGNEMLTTCVRRPILDNPAWFTEVLTAYRAYKAGFLPNEGSLNNQPLGYRQLINIIDEVLSECSNIKEEKERRKQANNSRGVGGIK